MKISRTHFGKALLFGAALLLSGPLPAGHAQVTTSITPTTGGGYLGTVVTPAVSIYTITGGTRPGGGTNLFHSFGLFSVGAGNTANFFNDTGLSTNNILGRVTGGSVSNIYGTIQTTGFPGAHLYLLNPAGVIFGPDAQLNLEGSFHVSTADYLKFANTNGDKFFVNPNNTNTALSVDPIAAFGFLSSNPGGIGVVLTELKVPDGQTLSLVGGDITLAGGKLTAPNGRINLASVFSVGEAVPSAGGFDVSSVPSLGIITVRASGGGTPSVLDVSGAGSGTVFIRGGQFTLDNSFIDGRVTGSLSGGAIDIAMTGAATITNGSLISTRTSSSSSGNAGAVNIAASEILLDSGAFIDIGSSGTGDGGSLILSGESVTIRGGAGINGISDVTGRGGNVDITATGQVFIGAGSAIITGTFGNSDAGSIAIHGSSPNAGPILVVDGGEMGTLALGGGNAGSILFDVATLSLTNGALISAFTASTGQAGTIEVNARDAVLVSGGSSIESGTDSAGAGGSISISTKNMTVDGGLITALTQAGGTAGAVAVQADTLTIRNGGVIDSSSAGSGDAGSVTITAANSVMISGQDNAGNLSKITSGATSSGNAGRITVNTPRLVMNGGLISSAAQVGSTGRGGDVQVSAGNIDLNGGARISASSKGSGDAGNIFITAGDAFIARDSFVTTEALQADGGDITLHVAGRLVHLINSEITTHAAGDGGNITIDPQFIIVDASKIIASAGVNGGNITLVASNGIFISPDSVIDASGSLGVSGSINISAPTTSLSGTLAPLSQDFMQAAGLLSARCAARLSGKSSSFVLAGRDGLPPAPGEFLPSPLFGTGSTATLSAGMRPGAYESQWPSLQSRRLVLNQATPVGKGGCAL